METKTFTIKVADGTRFTNVTMNGNCFIFRGAISDDLLCDENLLEVTINGEVHENMTCTNKWEEDGSTWFILRDKTEDELKEMEINARIEFLMAIQGVE